jgi:hypothetical protein
LRVQTREQVRLFGVFVWLFGSFCEIFPSVLS